MPSFFSKDPREEVAITITPKTFVKVLLLIIITMFLASVVSRTAYAFTLIVIALFLALALHAPVSWFQHHLPGKLRGNRSAAAAITTLIMAALLALFAFNVVPPIIRETQSFIANAPTTLQQLRAQYQGVNVFIVRYHLQGQVDQITNELTSQLRIGTDNALNAITGVLSSLVSVLTILVLAFMALLEGPDWSRFMRQLIPNDHREHVERLSADMYRAVRGYVNGQVLLAVVASILVLPGLLIFHVPYPFALMGLVFICGLIPMVGHIIGALTVSFIALFYSPWSALGILIYYILYQQVETYLIQPRVQANTTNLSPLIVLASLVIGVSFDGLLGGLLAIPLVACLRVLLLDYLESRRILKPEASEVATD